jgi:hypothetical protein
VRQRLSLKRFEGDKRLLAMFWKNLEEGLYRGPVRDHPRYSPRLPSSVADPDRTVLCWWCREHHLASEVEQCMSLPMKRASAGNSKSSTSSALVAGLLQPYSELWAFLTARTYPDGTKRLTGRLSLCCDSGGIRLSCTDDQTGLYVSLLGNSVDDVFLAFEAGLAADDLPWRESKFQGRKK